MILTLVILLIIWLTLTCIYFINDSRRAWELFEISEEYASEWRKYYEELENRMYETSSELKRWKPDRDPKTGRFI